MPLPADGSKVKLGKGSLLLAPYESDGSPGALEFVGNVTALTLSADVTKAQIYSSTQASAPLLHESVVRIAYTIAATLTEFRLPNLKKFLLAEQTATNQAALAGQTKVFDGAEVKRGGYLDLGVRRPTAVVITADGTDALVLGTDYSIITEFGLIRLLPNGSVSDGESVSVQYTQPALILDQARIAKEGTPTARLLYLADDANTDGDAAHDRLEIWRVSIAPDGDLNLISDEYASFNLSLAVLSDSEGHPDDPFGTLERVRE
jgi:hypothetical protein